MNNSFVFHAVKSADVTLIADVQNSDEVIQEHSFPLQQTLHTSRLIIICFESNIYIQSSTAQKKKRLIKVKLWQKALV